MKFSVIIPAHNSGDYAWRALESIKKQTFKDYELIVVCDACTDDTRDLAKIYTDKVLEVDFHNDGLTRQAGVDIAEGDWILFMDDDDRWLHDYVLSILDQACDPSFDVIAFGFVFKGKGVVGPMMTTESLWPNVWSKAWRSDYCKRFRFKKVDMESDFVFCSEAIPGAKIRLIESPLYVYNYMRPGSQTEKARRGSDDSKGLPSESALA